MLVSISQYGGDYEHGTFWKNITEEIMILTDGVVWLHRSCDVLHLYD
jgi:hypothetical protein